MTRTRKYSAAKRACKGVERGLRTQIKWIDASVKRLAPCTCDLPWIARQRAGLLDRKARLKAQIAELACSKK